MCWVQKENSWKPFIMYNLFDQLEDIFEKYPDFCKLQKFSIMMRQDLLIQIFEKLCTFKECTSFKIDIYG